MGNAPREKFVQPDFDDPCKTLGGCAAKRRENKLRELVKHMKATAKDPESGVKATVFLTFFSDQIESLLES